MKLWIDDIRVPPDDEWVWVKNYDDARRYITINWYEITDISLDHDLGENSKTGYDILVYIEGYLATGGRTCPWITFNVHSANPVGCKNMEAAIQSIKRLSIDRFKIEAELFKAKTEL